MHQTCQRCRTRFETENLKEPYRELRLCGGCCNAVLAAGAAAGDCELPAAADGDEPDKRRHKKVSGSAS